MVLVTFRFTICLLHPLKDFFRVSLSIYTIIYIVSKVNVFSLDFARFTFYYYPMSHNHDHGALIKEVAAEYEEILTDSEQAIYIFLDDDTKICNKKFSDLLGYESEQTWSDSRGSFTDLFVANESQRVLVSAYQKAMEKFAGSESSITWKTADGKTVDTKVIVVPIVFQHHLLALHFVSKA